MESNSASASVKRRNEQCTPSLMLNAAKHLGRNWKRLGRQLDIEEALLEDIEDKYRAYGFQEMAYQVMVIWQQTVGKEATISALEENLSVVERMDDAVNYPHVAAATSEQKTSSGSEKTYFLKDLQERLRRQYKGLGMKGLPWMEDLLLTLDEYYVDLTMSRLDRSGRNLASESIKIEDMLQSGDDESKPSRVLVEGGPGLGKTTLAAKLAYDWGKEATYISHFDLVLLLPLRHFVEDFEDTVRRAAAVNNGDKGHLLELLNDRSKHILFILDGYDEASPKMIKTVLPIIQGHSFSHVTVLVTSRPGKFPSKPEMSKRDETHKTTEFFESADIVPTFSYFIDRRVRIEGFTSDQQVMFMKKHLRSCTEQQELNILSNLDKIIDKEFLKCPLFLLMLIVACPNNNEDFKSFETKTDLYKHVFNCVIRRYFSKSGDQSLSHIDIFSSKDCSKRTPHDLITQFCNFSLWAIKTESLCFSREDILDVNDCDSRILDLGFLMQSVQVKGLRETLVYEPVHKSLLEFAAAYAVWLSFTLNGLDLWKEDAILLRPTLQNYLSRQLCFPFLAGLMGLQVAVLFGLLTPFASEYSSEFSMLILTLLETKVTDEVLHCLKPLLPVNWLVPWLKIDNGFGLSSQHEAVVRFGAAKGVIKFINWEFGCPARLPSDVEFETIVCEMSFYLSPFNTNCYQFGLVSCKDLWFNFGSVNLREVNMLTLLHAHDIFTYQRISYNFRIMPEWFPALNNVVAAKDLHIHWLKLSDNPDVKHLLPTVTALIKEERIKNLALLVEADNPQKHIDMLVKCASKSSTLTSFILRRGRSLSDFVVDLTLLFDNSQKEWNWVLLEGIKAKCSRVFKKPVNIRMLDFGSSELKFSSQNKFKCNVKSAMALRSSLLGNPFGTWNLSDSLQELNIVVEQPLTDDGLSHLKTKLPNLKTLVLTMTMFERKCGANLGPCWFLTSDVINSLQRLEIWKVETNPVLAREIVEDISCVLQYRMREPAKDHKSCTQLQYFLLNMPITYYKKGLNITSSYMKVGEMFLPAIFKLKQCLVEKALCQLEIVHVLRVYATPQNHLNSWRTLFPTEEGFKSQFNIWGTEHDDSIYSKGMYERSPGLLQKLSVLHEAKVPSD